MDARQKITICSVLREDKRKADAHKQLMIAEAFTFAYVGSQPATKGQVNRGQKGYSNWRREKMKVLNKNLKQVTVWDCLQKQKGKRGMIIN